MWLNLKSILLKKSISIVISAYKKDENILTLIRKIRKNINCLIVVVNVYPSLKTKKLYLKIR
tara:strand:- start:623 stop:808 length:186 start_codon:yes stop_codon:yes gene_type:complete